MPSPPSRGRSSPPALADALTSAAGYAAAEKATATRRAYRSDWRAFSSWCRGADAVDLPAAPGTVYLAHLADTGLRASTIARRGAAIAYAHKLKGLESPTSAEAVHVVMRGIRRKIGTAAAGKAPATAKAIAAMLAHAPDNLIGRRDRAILLIGCVARVGESRRSKDMTVLRASRRCPTALPNPRG
jgi:site-specific recombinase XerD